MNMSAATTLSAFGDSVVAVNDDAPLAADNAMLAEIEARLATIIAMVRDVAASAEELLREMSMPPGQFAMATARRATLDRQFGMTCVPFLVDASRVQIVALHAMIARHQRSAA
jgi:hypothetical protein